MVEAFSQPVFLHKIILPFHFKGPHLQDHALAGSL